jgi:hypothetical protein
MIPRLPYLQNAVSGFHKQYHRGTQSEYIKWMKNQGVIMPIKMHGLDIDSIYIEFTDPELETMFILRWA